MSQFGQYDSVPQRLLQLGGGGKLLPQTRLHPPEEEEEEEGEQTDRVMRVRSHTKQGYEAAVSTDLLASSSLQRY